MTVTELIDQLKIYPPDLPIHIEMSLDDGEGVFGGDVDEIYRMDYYDMLKNKPYEAVVLYSVV